METSCLNVKNMHAYYLLIDLIIFPKIGLPCVTEKIMLSDSKVFLLQINVDIKATRHERMQ